MTDAVAAVHDILAPLTAEERRKVVRAALTLLDDDAGLPAPAPQLDRTLGDDALPPAAAAWAKKYGVEVERLHKLFHFDHGRVTCIELPRAGRTKREDVVSTYLLQGVASLLSGGDGAFSDDDARKLCEHFGCYDSSNHSKALGEFGSSIAGSKSSGWKLTAPGLAAAATLVKS